MKLRKLCTVLTWTGCLLLAVLLIWLAANGYLKNPENLQQLLLQFGWFGPVFFIAVQILQVIVPVIPGGFSCALGVLAFGSAKGFLYNYIGLVTGSLLAFWLIRQCGRPLLKKLLKPEDYRRYVGWLDNGKRFEKLFTVAIFLPAAPDDILCMVAGLSEMSFSRFTVIILLGKPLALLAYSLGMVSLLQLLPF